MNKIINKYNKIKFKYENKKNFISVIIPVYKDTTGLSITLNSLKNQSLNKEYFEIIVVNDGAEINITNICKDHSVSVIEISPNMGSYFARNKGIENSSGEYIAFLDADIKVKNNWIENGLKELKRNTDYLCGKVQIDESKIKTVTNFYKLHTAFPVKRYLNKDHFGPTANLFVKRKVINMAGGFDIRLKSGGDTEFGSRIYHYTNFKQVYIENITVIHPPRNYKEEIKKIKRITKGAIDLNKFYPNRFSNKIKITDFFPIKIENLGGIEYNKKFIIKYLLGYWFKLIKTYYKIKFKLTKTKNNINECKKINFINFKNKK